MRTACRAPTGEGTAMARCWARNSTTTTATATASTPRPPMASRAPSPASHSNPRAPSDPTWRRPTASRSASACCPPAPQVRLGTFRIQTCEVEIINFCMFISRLPLSSSSFSRHRDSLQPWNAASYTVVHGGQNAGGSGRHMPDQPSSLCCRFGPAAQPERDGGVCCSLLGFAPAHQAAGGGGLGAAVVTAPF